jgi:hypothetical protein
MTKPDDKNRDDTLLFREAVHALHDLTPHHWTDWELGWMETQMRRRKAYQLSHKEKAILVRLMHDAKKSGADSVLLREKIRELRKLRGLTPRDAALQTLRDLMPHDWTDWELDWLDSQMRRSMGYERSEKEETVLTQLIDYSRGYTSHAGRNVWDWITVAYKFRFDLSEPQADFVEDLYNRRVALLRTRQLRLLLRILEQQDVLDVAA